MPLSKAVQKALGNKYPYLHRPFNGHEIYDGLNGGKAYPPRPADASSIPGDASLRCNFDPIFMPPVDAIETTFAKQNIIQSCKLFEGISLDETKQPAVQMPYEGVGVEVHTFAAWNTGDSPCISRRGGQISQ
jgi:hypothetical protein